jgi:hypothetical protein
MTSPAHLIHAGNILYILEKAGCTIDQFIEFWGTLLVVEIAGNGDRWYDRRQVEAFVAA